MTVTGSLPAIPEEVGLTVHAGRFYALRRALAPIFKAKGLQRWLLWIGIVITLIFVLMAVLAPVISPYGFNQYMSHGVFFPKQSPPSAAHLFGTTVGSEDVLSRVIWGAQTAVEVVVLAVIASVLIGVPLGLIAGYFGGPFDRIIVLIMDALFAFPYLLLAIVIAFILQNSIGGGVLVGAIAITVVYIPQYFRVVRNTVISVREEVYVEAARALGARPRTVIFRYIFINVIQSVPVLATLNAADAILTLAGLSFLGIGLNPTAQAQWGYDVYRAIDDILAGYWWTALFPGMAIVLLVTGLTFLGEGLNDTINPILRKRRIAPVVLPKRTATRPDGE